MNRSAMNFRIFCLFISLISLWLRSSIPVRVIADAIYDDALFIKLAAYLGTGQWLGPFDDLTLVKGMFYPLFILFSFLLGIPLKVAEQIIYLLSCYFVARMIIKHDDRSYFLSSFMFLVLALNPYLWTVALARVIREGIYITETLLSVFLTTSMSFYICSDNRNVKHLAILSFFCGLVLASFCLTREEAPWIIPALVVGVITAALRSRVLTGIFSIKAGSILNKLTRRALPPILISSAALALPIFAVATANLYKYGAFQTTEVQSYAFRRGYAALAGIEQNNWKRFVVFPKDARERAYRVSSAARELAPALDGPIGESWRRGGCEDEKNGEHAACSEILSGWFQWALRDAVSSAGHYSSAGEALIYYNQLANQIEEACRRGEIQCSPPRSTLAPPFRWSYVSDTVREMPAIGQNLMSFGSNLIGSLPSTGTDGQIAWFSDIVGQVEPPLTLPSKITGWIEAIGKPPSLSIQTLPNDRSVMQPEIFSGVDITPTIAGSSVERFSFATKNMTRDSRLVISSTEREDVSLPLMSLTQDAEIHEDDIKVHVDEGLQPSWVLPSRKREMKIQSVACAIAYTYHILSYPTIIIATIGIFIGLFRPTDNTNNLLYSLSLASVTGVVSRMALLSYLEVTSIPSNNILYLSPCSPLLIVFVVAGCNEMFSAVIPIMKGISIEKGSVVSKSKVSE